MAKSGNGQQTAQVAFDYIKANLFRVIHADGVIGGITPNGHIHMAVFSERQAIPRHLAHQLNDDKSLGEEIKEERISRDSIVREIDVDVIMTLSTADALLHWLELQVSDLKKRLGQGSNE